MKLFLKITITAMVLLGCYLFIPKGYDAYKKHQDEKKIEADQKKTEEKLERLREKYSILLQDAYDDKNDPYTQFNALEKIVNAPSEVVSMLNLREEHMYNLAIYYLNGHGTIKNLDKAIYWFCKYYKSPSVSGETKINAMLNVAWIYYESENYRETYKLLNEIIEMGRTTQAEGYYKAFYVLGYLYYNGYYLIQDIDRAIECWEEAAGGSLNGNYLFPVTKVSYDAAKNLYEYYSSHYNRIYTPDYLEIANSWKNRVEAIARAQSHN